MVNSSEEEIETRVTARDACWALLMALVATALYWFTLQGRLNTDGSGMDVIRGDRTCGRYGWSFVVLDDNGNVIAVARGVPPSWITDVPGTEAWGIFQAAHRTKIDRKYRIGCDPCGPKK